MSALLPLWLRQPPWSGSNLGSLSLPSPVAFISLFSTGNQRQSVKLWIRSCDSSAANPLPHGFQMIPSKSQVIIHGLRGLAPCLRVTCYPLWAHLIRFFIYCIHSSHMGSFLFCGSSSGVFLAHSLPWLPLLEYSSSDICVAHFSSLLSEAFPGHSTPKSQTLSPYLQFFFYALFFLLISIEHTLYLCLLSWLLSVFFTRM